MNKPQFKDVLRSAVIAAIPLATQAGCVNTESARPPSPVTPVEVNNSCRTGETSRKSAQERYSAQISAVSQLNPAQCIELCKKTFEQRRIGGFNDLVKLESISASNCKTENRPYTFIPPGGRTSTPSTLISCDVDYTAIHSPYTCPRPVVGRAPHGLQVAERQTTENRIGQYLASMAAMETAAVTAFRYLARELEAYAAPEELISRAYQAAGDEVRHAEMAGLLSAAYEADVPVIQVDDFRLRSLYEIALENAVEGCVNETFAAACGLWQSQHAQMDVFRPVIGHITDEEMEHAALSWDIHAWIMPQLSAPEQAQIRAAQDEAIASLVANFKQEGDLLVQETFGIPSREEAARLFAQLKGSIWA